MAKKKIIRVRKKVNGRVLNEFGVPVDEPLTYELMKERQKIYEDGIKKGKWSGRVEFRARRNLDSTKRYIRRKFAKQLQTESEVRVPSRIPRIVKKKEPSLNILIQTFGYIDDMSFQDLEQLEYRIKTRRLILQANGGAKALVEAV